MHLRVGDKQANSAEPGENGATLGFFLTDAQFKGSNYSQVLFLRLYVAQERQGTCRCCNQLHLYLLVGLHYAPLSRVEQQGRQMGGGSDYSCCCQHGQARVRAHGNSTIITTHSIRNTANDR